MRLDALLNEAQFNGRPPTSVAGGDCTSGNCLARSGVCGPGSVRLLGVLALMAPCAGSSGLPKVAACAEPTMAAPAADSASKSRRENIAVAPQNVSRRDVLVATGLDAASLESVRQIGFRERRSFCRNALSGLATDAA